VSAAWITVLAVGAGTVVLKAVGPVGLAHRQLPPRIAGLTSMVAPAILAALVVSETFAHGRAGAIALRAPLWVVIVAGALATAAARLVT
jgi:branched-subunit amino acid transport protein